MLGIILLALVAAIAAIWFVVWRLDATDQKLLAQQERDYWSSHG